MREALRFLVGGCLVYGVMAACSGAEPVQRAELQGGAGHGATGAGGQSAIDASGLLERAVDAMVQPVKEAAAQALPPQVDDVPCSKTYPYSGGVYQMTYAEKLYPGKTAVELSRITVLTHATAGALNYVPGYEFQQNLAQVKDGAVAVSCGVFATEGGAPPPVSVRFILPTL